MNIFGTLAAIASLVIALVGLPAQILKNYKKKSCEGLASSLIYSTCITYALWSLYGVSILNWFLIISQTPGFVLSLIVVTQLMIYKQK